MVDIATDCVRLNLDYHPGISRTNASATPVFRDILLENVHCQRSAQQKPQQSKRKPSLRPRPAASSSSYSYYIQGLPESHIANLSLRNVTMARGLAEVSCVAAECTCDKATVPCPACCERMP
jgi:hypothetical protein